MLIIITGKPCTGKTSLGRRIANEFKLAFISRDDIKEALFDSLGIKDRQWSKKLGIASYAVMYKLVDVLLLADRSIIVESNFVPQYDDRKILDLSRKFGFSPFQIVCKADGKVLLERFKQRSESGERHLGHVDDQNYEEFKALLVNNTHQVLDIGGEVLEIDTTDFASIDYQSIFDAVRVILKKKEN